MQSYDDILDTDEVTDSRQKILNRDDTLLSCSSGTAFPTSGILVGMFCLRTDLGDAGQVYQLKDTTPTWVLVADLAKTYLPEEDADARYLLLAGGSMTGDATFANAKGVKGKDSGGTSRSISLVTNTDVAQFGDAGVAAQMLGTSQKLTPAGGTQDAVLTGDGANLDTYVRPGKTTGKVVVGDTAATILLGKSGATSEVKGALKVDEASTLVGAVDAQGGLNVSSGSLQQGGVNAMLTGKHGFFIPAQAMLAFDCGALVAVGSGGGNPYAKVLQFDPSTQQNAHFDLLMPNSWDLGAITYRFVWGGSSGTAGQFVKWGVSARWVQDGGGFNTAFTTSGTVTDAFVATGDLQISGDISHTPEGAASGAGLLSLRFFRVAADVGDTLTGTAYLYGVYMLPNFTGNADS